MEQTAVFGGGCFWCTEAIFKRIKGVLSVTSGYADSVEVVKINFDPKTISFDQLLVIFWAIHDPTTLNRQGNDVGPQYKSAIFYQDKEQETIAEKSKAKLIKTGIKIVTEIKPLQKFNTAEEYHQNYYERNKNTNPYCALVIDPKIQKLLDKFNDKVKEEYK